MAFERKLYVIRKRADSEIRTSTIDGAEYWYVPSLSYKTLVYKGMLLTEQLAQYFTGPAAIRRWRPRWRWCIRASAPTPSRAGTARIPYRYIAHNGEINTLRGNINWMHARAGPVRLRTVRRGHQEDPADHQPERQRLGDVRQLPRTAGPGRPLAAARDDDDDPGAVGEPREHGRREAGVLRISFLPDGAVGRPGLDRLHRRQADRRGASTATACGRRATTSPRTTWSSWPRKPACSTCRRRTSCSKGRLQPGRMFLVDTEQGRIVADEEIKQKIATEHPYRQWLDEHLVHLEDLPAAPEVPAPDHETLLQRQLAFGYTFEDLRMLLDADGARRRRGARLDGQRHAAGGAVEQAAAALQLLQAAVRPGHQSADRLHPRGDHHLGRDLARLGGQPAAARSRATAAASSSKWPILTNEEFAKLRRHGPARLQGRRRCRSCSASRAARRAWPRRWRSCA